MVIQAASMSTTHVSKRTWKPSISRALLQLLGTRSRIMLTYTLEGLTASLIVVLLSPIKRQWDYKLPKLQLRHTAFWQKGIVWIPLNGGIQIHANHVPHFTSNILAGNMLSDHFEVLRSSSIRSYKGCVIFRKGSLRVEDIICETRCIDRLYPMSLSDCQSSRILRTSTAFTTRKTLSLMEWHQKTEHSGPQRYQQILYLFEDVPITHIGELQGL